MANKPEFGFQTGYGAGAPQDSSPPPDQPQFGFQTGYGANSQQTSQQPPQVGAMTAFETAQDLAPWNLLRQKTLDPTGKAVAEVGGAMGFPKTGATLGTAIQVAPEILAAGTSLQGLYNSESPLAQGITKTPQEIGQQMQVGEQGAGVSNQLPIRSGLKARFPINEVQAAGPTPDIPAEPLPSVAPTSYPKNTNALLNFAQQRIQQFGDQLSPDELNAYKKIFPEMFSKGEIMRGTPQYAMASDVQSKVNDLYNQAIPGREALNKAYGISKTLHPDIRNAIMNYIQKYGKSALKEAIGVGAGLAGANALKDLFK